MLAQIVTSVCNVLIQKFWKISKNSTGEKIENYSEILKSWAPLHNMHAFFLLNYEFKFLTRSAKLMSMDKHSLMRLRAYMHQIAEQRLFCPKRGGGGGTKSTINLCPSCPCYILISFYMKFCPPFEDGVAQLVEHRTAVLAARVRSPVGEEPSDLMCAFLHVQMESNGLGCQCVTVGTLASDVAL